MTHGAPGEEQVRQLLERWPASGNDLQLRAIELRPIARLDEQPAIDAVEVEARDAVVADALEGLAPNREQREMLLSRRRISRAGAEKAGATTAS